MYQSQVVHLSELGVTCRGMRRAAECISLRLYICLSWVLPAAGMRRAAECISLRLYICLSWVVTCRRYEKGCRVYQSQVVHLSELGVTCRGMRRAAECISLRLYICLSWVLPAAV